MYYTYSITSLFLKLPPEIPVAQRRMLLVRHQSLQLSHVHPGRPFRSRPPTHVEALEELRDAAENLLQALLLLERGAV